MSEKLREGWGFPFDSRKAHYFVKEGNAILGISLCRAWMYGGKLEQGNDDSPDNCATCMKKLNKKKKAK